MASQSRSLFSHSDSQAEYRIEGEDSEIRQEEISLQDVDPLSASASAAAPSNQLLFSDASYAPSSFNGTTSQDADRWLRRFKYYVEFRQLSEGAAVQLFKLLMTESAADWLESVSDQTKGNLTLLYKAFTERFADSDMFRWKQASAIFARQQGATETVDTYITDIQNLAKKVPIKDETLIRFALIKGLKPAIRQHVLQTSSTTLDDTIKAARISEAAATQCPTDSADVASLSKDVRDLLTAFKALQTKSSASTPERVAAVNTRSPVNSRYSSPRRVSFTDERQSLPTQGDRDRRAPAVCRPVTYIQFTKLVVAGSAESAMGQSTLVATRISFSSAV